MRSLILFLSVPLAQLSLPVPAQPIIDPWEKLPKELRENVVGTLSLPDLVAAANVNLEWRATILEEPTRLNKLAETRFSANPLSYYSSGISDSEADQKLLEFSPLIGNLVRSIVVQSIHLSLSALCFDKLGNPVTGQFRAPPGATLPILTSAIQDFKPELEWLDKSAHIMKVNEGSAEVFDVFFPILGKIRTGDSENLAPMIKYVFSDTFSKSICRQLERWVPSRYIMFLAILRYANMPRTTPLSDVDHMADAFKIYLPAVIQRDISSTLGRAISTLVVQTNNFQQTMDTGRIIKFVDEETAQNYVGMDYTFNFGTASFAEESTETDFGPEHDVVDMPPPAPIQWEGPLPPIMPADMPGSSSMSQMTPVPIIIPETQNMAILVAEVQKRHELVEALSDPKFMSQPHDIIGYCAVEIGLVKRTLLPENWTTPTKERLVDQLKGPESEIPQLCSRLFTSNDYPIFLDTDGDASVRFYPYNSESTELSTPEELSTLPIEFGFIPVTNVATGEIFGEAPPGFQL
ncbi:hypothetical protein BJ085DRAFT_30782 [Dimargaris cristalligena]|uniref:F-box domain-containing protein n=1 Tax=Dimargaris cristalligena TaxID=215637 RepID=A0A4P9ZV22_9FUNG|nr:hypothetical protein BJ085DRAFT_30782 [Dimargaris cristalligena]|eukprot:RKP37417.1 hypothetical protein BJ085DRAFT_30782 [Dimargaris cristalligena]